MSLEAKVLEHDVAQNLRSCLPVDGKISEAIWRFLGKAGRGQSGDSCWNWAASLTQDGYGRFSYLGKQSLAHRFSYWLFVGDVPAGIKVCHTCDNPQCCNPGHLFLGTNADNLRDMAQKGRSTHGEKNPNRKLSESQIAAILADGRKHRDIADQYGVTRSQISHIKRGVSWKRFQGGAA